MTAAGVMDIQAILDNLPHRYPMLLVDRVLECIPGERLVAVKNVSFNEPFFQGHFPHEPVMPGVLVIEAMAQATNLLSFATSGKTAEGEVFFLAGIDNARFKRPVLPGDQLMLHTSITRQRRDVCWFSARAEVEGQLVARADVMGGRGRVRP